MTNKTEDKVAHCLLGVVTRCWMLPCIASVIVATATGIAAAASTTWLQVNCDDDVISVGLHQVCFANMTSEQTCHEVQEPQGAKISNVFDVTIMMFFEWLFCRLASDVSLSCLCCCNHGDCFTSLFCCTPVRDVTHGFRNARSSLVSHLCDPRYVCTVIKVLCSLFKQFFIFFEQSCSFMGVHYIQNHF